MVERKLEMGILKNNQKTNIRFKQDEVILYEPNEVQKEELRLIILDNTKLDLNSGEAVSEYSYNLVRYMLRFLTSVGEEVDELTDDELEVLIENGNGKIASLMRAIENLLREVTEEMIYKYIVDIKNVKERLRMAEAELDIGDIKKTFNTISEKANLNKTFDELIEEVKK
jgi:hypothetical protein